MTNQILLDDMLQLFTHDLPFERLRGKSILITGAAGMIPSYLTMLFLQMCQERHPAAPARVIALTHRSISPQSCLGAFFNTPYFMPVSGDISDDAVLERLPACDYVIHGASPASPQHYGKDPAGTFLPNVIGTYHLLRMCEKWQSKGFLFLSSGEVYGVDNNAVGPQTEEAYGVVDHLAPRSCYAEGKRAGETMCAIWSRQFQVRTGIARISHTYGPTMHLDNDKRIFADFIRNILEGQPLCIKSDGSAVRSFCYLRDAVDGLLRVLLLGADGEAYNLCGEQSCSISELAETLRVLFSGRKLKIVYQERSLQDSYLSAPRQKSRTVNTDKLRALGWRPEIGISEGFYRTVLAIRQGGIWD